MATVQPASQGPPTRSRKGTKNPASSKKGAQGAHSKSKAPPPSPEEKTKKYFKSLSAQIEGGHFANAVKTCDKIIRLASEPSDVPEALQAKVFCLLHLEKSMEALTVLDTFPCADATEAGGIERAYAFYRLNKEPSVVLPLLDQLERPNIGRGGMHLKAQLCYRNGMYEEAVYLYNELLDTCDVASEEYKDTENNLLAAQQRLEFERTGFKESLHTIDVSRLQELPPPIDLPITTTANRAPVSVIIRSSKPNPTAKPKTTQPPSKNQPKTGPDPERWVKKSERESYRPSRRDRGAQGTTQGLRSK